MADPTRAPRREEPLSRERIVEATVEMLDRDGEGGVTVRAITARLSTGRGALYHHVSGKDELLALATDSVVARLLEGSQSTADAVDDVRELALGLFATIDAHPWVGTRLVREPNQPAVLRIWSAVGAGLTRLQVAGPARADAGAALVSYVLGAAAQHAAGARRAGSERARQDYLDALGREITERGDPLGPDAVRHLREHDDREQFLAGVDIFLAGVRARR